MSLRFWRRKTILPGLRANLSKSGVSLSIGRKGAWFTTGPRGRRATVGVPGSGLFWTERVNVPHAVQGRPEGSGSLGQALALAVAQTFIAFCGLATVLFVIGLFVHASGH
jgi:hypothetical protein